MMRHETVQNLGGTPSSSPAARSRRLSCVETSLRLSRRQPLSASPRPVTTTGKDVSWLVEGEARMQWRVMVELSGADGSVQTLGVHVGGCLPAACSAETLGLTQAQGKQLLA